MKSEGFLGTLKYVAVRVAIAEIVILALTGVVCWMIGWRTLTEYATGLILTGFVVIFFGAGGVWGLGADRLYGDFRYQYSNSVMPNSASQRMRQNISDLMQDISFTLWSGLIGVITILLGIVLKALIYL
ncbi:MAG: hypothetical protein HY867_01965 [Chloroflexi bacterium]|nr:hypothetical protein [Chloroflexota bacterium]